MIRPVFTVLVLLAFISLANAQVGLRFSAVQSNLQKYENATQESIYGLGFGVFWRKYIDNVWFSQPEFSFQRSGGTLKWGNGDFLTLKPNYISFTAPVGYVLKRKPFGLIILTGPKFGIGTAGKFESKSTNGSFQGSIEYHSKVDRSTRGFYPGGVDIYFLRPLNFEWLFELVFRYQSFGFALVTEWGINNIYPKRSDIDTEGFSLRTRTNSLSLIYYLDGIDW